MAPGLLWLWPIWLLDRNSSWTVMAPCQSWLLKRCGSWTVMAPGQIVTSQLWLFGCYGSWSVSYSSCTVMVVRILWLLNSYGSETHGATFPLAMIPGQGQQVASPSPTPTFLSYIMAGPPSIRDLI